MKDLLHANEGGNLAANIFAFKYDAAHTITKVSLIWHFVVGNIDMIPY